MLKVGFRARGSGRRYVKVGVATSLAAVASLGFAAPAFAISVVPVAQVTGKAGNLSLSMDSPTTGRQVNVSWDSSGVAWGTADPKQWTVEITPPAGGTLVDNQCVGVTESNFGYDSCTFTGSVDGIYSVKVTAGDSTDSATGPITVKQVVGPGKPQNVKVLSGPNELVVSWQPPADLGDGVGGYHAEAAMENAQSSGPYCETTTALTCVIKDVVAGESYKVGVGALPKQYPDCAYCASPAWSDLVKVLGPATSTPTPPASVPTSAGKLTAPSASVTPNQAVTLSGSGYAANTPVQIVVYSTPQVLKTVTTDATGSFSTSVTLPAGLTGSHTLVAGGVGPDGAYRYLTLPVTAAAAAGLPVTGAAVPKLVAAALAVLAIGFVLVRVTRRRSVFRA